VVLALNGVATTPHTQAVVAAARFLGLLPQPEVQAAVAAVGVLP
jgi:hypothetical protein